MDISPSAISTARYNFLSFCCVMIPLGWLLGCIFLQLYFKYDEGYFSIANVEFRYHEGVCIQKNHEKTKQYQNIFKCFETCHRKGNVKDTFDGQQHEAMTIPEDAPEGYWVDLSGQSNYEGQWHFEDLTQEEQLIFDEIINTFPTLPNY